MVGTCQITLPGVISATIEPLTLQGTITPSVTAPRYPGPYEVMPSEDAQVLATSGRVMSSDVSVAGIPYYEVTNPQGGSTFIIGRTNDYTE